MKNTYVPAMAALLLGATPTVFSGNTAEPIIVTATRTAQTANESLASVTVISRKDIERQQARSIQDLLRGVPGVSIANNGGPGKNTSVFMRGTNSDHVLVMIDGIKVGSATTEPRHSRIFPLIRLNVSRLFAVHDLVCMALKPLAV